jgi:hypothetical protein
MMNKRGLSNIVATVLIVLLALAAVAIVWGFLRPTFNRAASSTNLKSSCFLVELEPTLCSVNYTSGVANVAYQLVSDNERLSAVTLVVEDNNGITKTNNVAERPANAMESKIGEVTSLDTTAYPYTARVAAVVSDGTNTEVCAESADLACTDNHV